MSALLWQEADTTRSAVACVVVISCHKEKKTWHLDLLTYRGAVSLITLSTLVQGNVKNPQLSGGCAAIFERCHKDTSSAGRLKVSQPGLVSRLAM